MVSSDGMGGGGEITFVDITEIHRHISPLAFVHCLILQCLLDHLCYFKLHLSNWGVEGQATRI